MYKFFYTRLFIALKISSSDQPIFSLHISKCHQGDFSHLHQLSILAMISRANNRCICILFGRLFPSCKLSGGWWSSGSSTVSTAITGSECWNPKCRWRIPHHYANRIQHAKHNYLTRGLQNKTATFIQSFTRKSSGYSVLYTMSSWKFRSFTTANLSSTEKLCAFFMYLIKSLPIALS